MSNKLKNILTVLKDYKIFFYDLETTGFFMPMPIEIAICDIDGNTVFNNVIHTNRINDGYIANKISDNEIIKKGENKYDLFDKIIDTCGDKCIFIGHSCKTLDLKILAYELQQKMSQWKFICTCEYARNVDKKYNYNKKKGRKSYSLETLKEIFDINIKNAHRALSDTLSCKMIFEKLLEIDKLDYKNKEEINKNLLIENLDNITYGNNLLFKNLINTQYVQSIDVLKDKITNFIKINCPKIRIECDIIELNNSINYTFIILKNGEFNIKCVIKNDLFKKIPQIKDKIIVDGEIRLYNNSIDIYALDYIIVGENKEKKTMDNLIRKLDSIINRERKIINNNYKKIGVISSVKSKGFADLTKTIINKTFNTEVILYNTGVQGNDAIDTIIDAIRIANEHNYVEILALVRGGGSTEDYKCFNNEKLALKIYESKIPIVTGIGHSTDNTLCDLVSEKNFLTPTACGESLVEGINIQNIKVKLNNIYSNKLSQIILQINNIENHLDKLCDKKINDNIENINKFRLDLNDIFIKKINEYINKTIKHEQIIKNKIVEYMNNYDKKINDFQIKLDEIYNKKIIINVKSINKDYHKILIKLLNKIKNEI